MKNREINILYFSILIIALAFTYSFLAKRPLMSEGAHWYYSILEWRSVFSDYRLYRYVDYLIQFPAVILLRYYGDVNNLVASNAAIILLTFNWTFHPLVSFFFSNKILKSYGRQDLLIFQILALLSAYMPAAPYAVALALPAISCFWPLFFYSLFADGRSKANYVYFAALITLLAVCYEAVPIFFALLAGFAALDVVWFKRNTAKFNAFVILISFIFSAVLLYLISGISKNITGPFWESLFSNFDTYRMLGLWISGLTVLLILFSQISNKHQKLVCGIFFLMYVTVLYHYGNLYLFSIKPEILHKPYGLYSAYNSRSTALPITTLIAFCCGIFVKLKAASNWLNSISGRFVVIVVLIFSAFVSLIDIELTNQWREARNKIENMALSRKGCVNLTSEEYTQTFKTPAVETYAIPFASVVMQILNDVEPINTVIFTSHVNSADQDGQRNVCLDHKDGVFISNQGFQVNLNTEKIKFSKATILGHN